MKKLLLIAFLALPFFGLAQDTDNHLYATITGTNKLFSNKKNIKIDYGQGAKGFGQNKIIDESTGKPKGFNSMVDAMNFMGSLGWKFVQAYAVTEDKSTTHYWLIKIEVTDEDIEEFIPTIKSDLK